MEADAAAFSRNAGQVQRALQLWLIAQEQLQRFQALDCYRDVRRRVVRRPVDADLHLAEFGRFQLHAQPLRAIRCVAH